MTAPVPSPSYISVEAVQQLISDDKVLVGTDNTTEISPDTANQLVAQGEGTVLWDLSPYYVTDPALITTTGGDWTTLPSYVYNILYNMFCYQGALELIGNYIARNTDENGRTLSYFQQFYTAQYNNYLNRIVDKLPNGDYKYILTGLQPLNTGIPRRPKAYAKSGNLGVRSYSDRQVTNPQRNFSNGLPFWGR